MNNEKVITLKDFRKFKKITNEYIKLRLLNIRQERYFKLLKDLEKPYYEPKTLIREYNAYVQKIDKKLEEIKCKKTNKHKK